MEAAETPKPPDGPALLVEGAKWLERIRASEKREDKWRKDAEAAEKAFSCDADAKVSGKLYDFNILHSNVETIVPAIYNSTPIPDIRRRFQEAGEEPTPPEQPQQAPGQPVDPRAVQQFQMAQMQFQQAMQAYQAKQQQDKDAKSLGDMIERAIAVQIDDNRLDIEIEREAQDSFLAGRGIIIVKFDMDDDGEQVRNERIEFEAVSWRDFRMGPGTRWDNLPWIAFRHVVTSEALEKMKDGEYYASQGAETTVAEEDESKDGVAFWKIWCKDSRKVKFVREHDGRMLKEVEDPLGLQGFFPCPEPVQPITVTGKMRPVCPFTVYKKLADELDTITKRINSIMKGLKVKGAFAGGGADLAQFASAGDNELVALSDLEALAQTGGIDKAIMWWPVEKAIQVLKELYAQRETVKSSIYEITGISDIVRGASNANETLGAQEIKTRWGALRIQKMQRMIERQVRDIFVMMADLLCTKFQPQTLQAMTGVEITEGMQALMQQPRMMGYRIDVESDSTVRADLTRQKEDMGQFLDGTANFFGTMAPLIQQAPETAEPVAEIYASMASVFKLGRSAEDALERMKQMAKQAAKNPPPNPEAEAAKAEMALKEKDAEIKANEAKGKAVERQQENDRKQQEHDAEMAQKEIEATERRDETAAKREIETIKIQAAREKAENERQQAVIDLKMKEIDLLAQVALAAQPKAEEGGEEQKPADIEPVLNEIRSLIQTLSQPKSITTPDGRKYTAQIEG